MNIFLFIFSFFLSSPIFPWWLPSFIFADSLFDPFLERFNIHGENGSAGVAASTGISADDCGYDSDEVSSGGTRFSF